MRTVALLAPALLLFFACRTAGANPGITGYSGKPYNGVSDTCKTVCHTGTGAVPTMTVTVPTSMKAGDTAQVTIVVDGSRTRTSLNAALSDGVVATKGQNTDIPFPDQTPGEVAAVTPPPSGADGTYKFSFVAPQKNGPITLWIAAMSANGSGTSGDGVATTTRTITVSGATAPPPDAGAPTDGGTSKPDAGTAGPSTDGGSGGDADPNDPSDPKEPSSGRRAGQGGDDASGCQASRRGVPPLGAGAVAALTMLLVGRRRRNAQRTTA